VLPATGTDAKPYESVVKFAFDQDVSGATVTASKYHLAGFDGNLRFDGQQAALDQAGSAVFVTFGTATVPVGAAQMADVSIASISPSAVVDSAGDANPPGAVPVGSARTVTNTPGRTVAPDLVAIEDFSHPLTDPTHTSVLFKFDQPAFVASAAALPHLAMADGSVSNCTFSSGAGTDTLTATCANPGLGGTTAIDRSQVTAGYVDAGAVSSDPQRSSSIPPQGATNVLSSSVVTTPTAATQPPAVTHVDLKPNGVVTLAGGEPELADQVVFHFDQPVGLGRTTSGNPVCAAPDGTPTGNCFVVESGDASQTSAANAANSGPLVQQNPPSVVADDAGHPTEVVLTYPQGTLQSAVAVAVAAGAVSAIATSTANAAQSVPVTSPGSVTLTPGTSTAPRLVAVHIDRSGSPASAVYYFDRDLKPGSLTTTTAGQFYLLRPDGGWLQCDKASQVTGAPFGENNVVTCTHFKQATVLSGVVTSSQAATDQVVVAATVGAVEQDAIVSVDNVTNAAQAVAVDRAPRVDATQPRVGIVTGGTAVSIVGDGFVNVRSVSFGNQPAQFEVVSPTLVRAIAPPAQGAGPVDVVVTAATGASALSAADVFTYRPRPSLSTISPGHGPTRGHTAVVITGDGISAARAVYFGSAKARRLRQIDSVTVRVVTPPHTRGRVRVSVVTASGTVKGVRYRFKRPRQP